MERENPFQRGLDVVFPDYADFCISNIPGMIETALGTTEAGASLTALNAAVDAYDKIVLLVLDGFGYRKAQSLFECMPESAIRRLGEKGRLIPLTSVYPSTTVSALTSLGTGLSPLEHGMIGYRLYLSEIAAITNMIRFTSHGNSRPDSAFALGLDPETLIPGPTLHGRLVEKGVSAHALLPHHIASSGLSTALYRGCSVIHSAVSFPDMLVKTRHLLSQATGKTFLSLYWPSLDTTAHVLGPDSESYTAEFCAIDEAIRRELIGHADDTLFIVTADHGFVTMQPSDYIPLDAVVDVGRALLMLPVGEPRASYLFTRDGGQEVIREAFVEARRDGLICLDSHELVASGLLGRGQPHPEIGNRIGQLAVLSTGSAGIDQAYPDGVTLRGMHGGLTADEMLVPLIVSPL